MPLSTRLMSIAPEDTSGARSANRFDYQLDWALLQVLELFPQGADFVIVLDFHDDVLILDSASDPSRVACYQIKTKNSGNWSVGALLRRERGRRGPKPSILGKLYSHVLRWSGDVSGLCFASNAPLSAEDQNGASTTSLDSVLFSNLGPSLAQQIADALTDELNLGSPLGGQIALFQFRRSQLNAVGHQEQCIGILAGFLETRPETTRVPAAAFYRTVKAEMARAIQREECPTTFPDLCRLKSLTRARFSQMLADAAAEPVRADHASALIERLNVEQVPFRDVQAIRRHATSLMTRRLDPTNQLLYDDIESIKRSIPAQGVPGRLWDAIEALRSSLARSDPAVQRRHGVDAFRALIGVVLLEQAQLSSAHPQTPEEGT